MMFKCEVEDISFFLNIKETIIRFKVSNIGSSYKPNHKLTGAYPNNSHFTIGEIDRSIKKGDLLRCDGLPYMSRPYNKKVSEVWTKDKTYSQPVKHKVYTDKVPGYHPFQLDSGYWVLRKNADISKRKETQTK